VNNSFDNNSCYHTLNQNWRFNRGLRKTEEEFEIKGKNRINVWNGGGLLNRYQHAGVQDIQCDIQSPRGVPLDQGPFR
jgi:hypothetical protein